MAVVVVQPFAVRSSLNCIRLMPDDKELPAIYAITAIGITISFAGIPRINAIKIIPSSPKSRAKGSKKFEHRASRVEPLNDRFAISQIRRPAGIAAITARPSTKTVRSRSERINILPI